MLTSLTTSNFSSIACAALYICLYVMGTSKGEEDWKGSRGGVGVLFGTRCARSSKLIYLPPHTSHVLQLLDLSMFGPLKHAYRIDVDNLNRWTDSAPIGRHNLLKGY